MEVTAAATVPPPPPPAAAITEPLVEVQQEVETTTSTPPLPPESPAQSQEASDAAETVQPTPTDDEQTPSSLPPEAESQSPPAEVMRKVRRCLDVPVGGLLQSELFCGRSQLGGKTTLSPDFQISPDKYFQMITVCSRNNTAEAIAAIGAEQVTTTICIL